MNATPSTMDAVKSGFDPGLGREPSPFRRLLDALPAGAYTCDSEGLILYYNDHAVRLWGRAPALNDPIDRFCGSFRLFTPEGAPVPHAECWMALALREGKEYNGHEIVVEQPDGGRRPVLAHASPFHDENGTLLGAVNVLVDITERKRSEAAVRESEDRLRELNQALESLVADRTEALRVSNAELEERNHDLEQFAFVASHDLQEPLRMVSSSVQILQRRFADAEDETTRRCMGYAVEGAKRMHNLIEDLLTYSRVGSADPRLEPIDMNQVVAAVLEDLRGVVAESGAVVETRELPTVRADGTQMRQLLQNLLCNAIKFRKPGTGPRIEIRAEPAGADAWRFTVADDGIGIDARYTERVFDVFQRLHARGEYEGTGIGLAICKRVVERHGGKMGVESAPGRGSTFHFTLARWPSRA